MKKYLPELCGIILCFIIAALGGMATSSSDFTWYASLHKPSFNPPNWVFAPVWTILYFLMGIALGKLWRLKARMPLAFCVFLFQLVFNLAWSFLFFQYHWIGLALIDIAILWLSILLLLILAWRERLIFCLLLPYGLWVSFALRLNIMLYLLNHLAR